MSAHNEEIIESIFVNDQIVPEQFKEFLKIVSNQLSQSINLQTTIERNEASNRKRFDDISLAIERINLISGGLQSQIDNVVAAQEMFRLMDCKKKQDYRNMIDTLYTESLNSEVCSLRRLSHNLKDLTDELVVKCHEMKEEIKTIQKQMFILEKIPLLEEKVALLLDWKALLREEFEQFAERYEHIKTVSTSRCEVSDLLKKKVDFIHLDNYVLKHKFSEARREFSGEFDQMKDLFCELQLQMNAKIVSLHKDVQRALTELASKRRLEKRGNKMK